MYVFDKPQSALLLDTSLRNSGSCQIPVHSDWPCRIWVLVQKLPRKPEQNSAHVSRASSASSGIFSDRGSLCAQLDLQWKLETGTMDLHQFGAKAQEVWNATPNDKFKQTTLSLALDCRFGQFCG
jgi:hypothetical protein